MMAVCCQSIEQLFYGWLAVSWMNTQLPGKGDGEKRIL